MKNTSILSVLVLPTLALSFANTALAQGLNPPPGAPTAVYKNLDQVEARTPLVAGQTGVSINGVTGTITISQPGSYYLTGNVTITTAAAHGINITADDVTVDLNGFVLSCTSVNGGAAVNADSRNGTRIHNGKIVGGTTVVGSTFTPVGWDRGVSADNSQNTTVSELTIRGARNDGIFCSTGSSLVEKCTVNVCGGAGARAHTLRDTIVRASGGAGAIMSSTLKDSGHVVNCYAENVSAAGQGIFAPDATVENSRGISIGNDGINARTVLNSRGESTSASGIRADIATSCFGSSVSSIGMQISGTASFCRSSANVTAMTAGIAIGCTAASGAITSAQKHLGTP